MKTFRLLATALVLFLFTGFNSITAQTARVQIIHNSADLAASSVDVWLNDTKLLENFSFRTATPFIDAPAGELLNIGVAPPNSTSWTQSISIKQVSLTEGQTYVIIANGIVSESGYNPSPNFDLRVLPIGREVASQPGNTDVLVAHGSTDAPTVDIFETGVGAGLIIDDLTYDNVAGYLELETLDYILEIRDETGTSTVAAYQAPLATLGLEGQALTVLASGFLNPANNSDGAPFGLYVALAGGGELVELPLVEPQSTARVQVIHNSADLAAASVDVWLNDTKLLEDFAFRTASPFIDAPAGEEFTIAIQGPGSTSPENPIWSQNYTLGADETYILVANGIVSASGYNPAEPFDIYVNAMGREEATMADQTDVLVFHGATDAPTVSVWETAAVNGQLFTFSYGDFTEYLELGTSDYILEVRDETGTVTVAAYQAPLATLGLEGQALSVMASGFLDPTANSDGPAFGLWVALADGGELIELPAYTPTARVQVIHNSADLAAASVDVWLDDTKLLEDFAFRTASPFIDAPAGVEFTIAIQAPGSTSPENPIWSQNYTLADGETYVLVANGIVSPTGYEPNQPFDIYVYDMGREESMFEDETDVLVFHGSTDAPTVSVWETAVVNEELFSFSYGDYAGYLELPTLDFVLEVRDETGTVTVASYAAPLATLGLEDEALTVVASGFLDPTANSDGPAFGLWVALADGGELIELPAYTPTARVQVIHNSADLAAASVDVWLDDTKLLENFAFRTASPFIDAPADVEFTIAIQAPGSTSPEDPIWSQNYTLADGETYVLVANGIVSPTGYEPNQPFDIYVNAMGREAAMNENETDVLVFHGATDAPTVSVWETAAVNGELFTFSYGEFAGYLELATSDYILEVRDETGTVTVAAYQAPLAALGLEGQALSVMASGFLFPEFNSEGAGFGLWVALADGGELIELPAYTPPAPTARVQVIHNSADLAAQQVDVWLNEIKLLEDFAFRNASPFIDAPAGEEFTIAIQGPGSTSPEDPIWSQNYTLEADETYVLIANGIVSPSGYDPALPFDIYVYPMAREAAINENETDVLVFHGSTDAPTVSVWEVGVGAGELFTFSYGDFAGYLPLATDNYSLQIRDETGETTVATFAAPLADLGLEGQAITVFASGFLNPANNSNGENFGLFAATTAGAVVPLTNTSNIENIIDVTSMTIYPNPAHNTLNIEFSVKQDDMINLEILNILGSKMMEQSVANATRNTTVRQSFDISRLPEGIYLLSINAGNSMVTRKIQVIR